MTSLSPSTLAQGELVGGRYRVERMLGEDTLGRSFLVSDTAATRKLPGQLGLRLLGVGLAALPAAIPGDEDPLVSWRAVAARVPTLSHPGVAAAVDLRVGDEHGRCYLVREAIELEGQTLAAVLAARGGALSEPEAIFLCTQIGEALEAAHQHGLLHLHLSPSRVLIGPPSTAEVEAGAGATVRVRIADLGLVPPGVAARFGEPGYLAPELLDGQLVDRRTDQFALAAILYEMLAGRPAFALAPDEPRHTIVGRVRNEDPLPLALPRRIEQALARALSRSRAVRFPSMRDFVQALGGDVSGWPPPLYPVSGAPGTTPSAALGAVTTSQGGLVVGPSSSSSPSSQSGRPGTGPMTGDGSLRHIVLPALLGGAVALLGLVGYRYLTRPTPLVPVPVPVSAPLAALPDLRRGEGGGAVATAPAQQPGPGGPGNGNPDDKEGIGANAGAGAGDPRGPGTGPEPGEPGEPDTPGAPNLADLATAAPTGRPSTPSPSPQPGPGPGPGPGPSAGPAPAAAPVLVSELELAFGSADGVITPAQKASLQRCVKMLSPRAPFFIVLDNLSGKLYVNTRSPPSVLSESDDFRNCVKELRAGNIEAKAVSIQGRIVTKVKGAR